METNQVAKSSGHLTDKASIIPAGEGRCIKAGEGSCTFKVTTEMSEGRIGIYELVIPPHTPGANMHYHRLMDETFIVQEGTLTVQVASATHQLTAGGIVHIPRFTPHAFFNQSDKALVVTLVFNPAENREGFFVGLFDLLRAPTMNTSKFLDLYHRYDSYLVENPLADRLLL